MKAGNILVAMVVTLLLMLLSSLLLPHFFLPATILIIDEQFFFLSPSHHSFFLYFLILVLLRGALKIVGTVSDVGIISSRCRWCQLRPTVSQSVIRRKTCAGSRRQASRRGISMKSIFYRSCAKKKGARTFPT